MRRTATPERGAALLVVMVSVAVLTAVAANLAYDSRVSLRIAANARDELRASYLARSGVTLSRLVLNFQQQVDALQKQQLPGASQQVPRFQIWRLLPAGSELARSLFPGRAAPGGGEAAPESGFESTIDDEGRKVNAQLDNTQQATSAAPAAAAAQALYQLICDPRWDRLFEREDANGMRTSRDELLVRLRDWVDENEVATTLNADFRAGGCAVTILPPPWTDSFGDENQPYDRGDDRYKVKNARMDSVDELYLIAGVGDAFMAAFGDSLTVYLQPNAKWNVNELDRDGLIRIAALMADPPVQPALYDPVVAERLQKLVLEQTLGGILTITPVQLGNLVLAAGITINQNKLQTNSYFTDQSNTFRVRSTGKAGAVTARIDAVVRTVAPQPGTPVAAPGLLLHWREE